MSEPIMPVSRYLLRHWARHLGPEGLCLVIAARQYAYLQNAKHGRLPGNAWVRMSVSKRRLARWAGVSIRTARRRIRPRPARPEALAVAAFVRPTNGDYHYLVRQEDPLAPQHARGLAAYIRQAWAQAQPRRGSLSAQRAREIAADALDALRRLPPEQALETLAQADADWAQGATGDDPPNPRITHDDAYLLGHRVTAIVDHLGALPERYAQRYPWLARCRALQEHLTTPWRFVVVRHRFWREWLPRLGPRRMGLVLALRSRCFHDPRTGETRETCAVACKALAAELGCSTRQLRRLIHGPDEADLYRFVRMETPARGPVPPTWWVRMTPGAGQATASDDPVGPSTARDAAKDVDNPPDVASEASGQWDRGARPGVGHGDRVIDNYLFVNNDSTGLGGERQKQDAAARPP
jgi:hypothetical protein